MILLHMQHVKEAHTKGVMTLRIILSHAGASVAGIWL